MERALKRETTDKLREARKGKKSKVDSLDLVTNQVKVPLLAETCVCDEGLSRVGEAYNQSECVN